MLILKRKVGQKICICGHEIEVSVERIQGDRVSLGIKAPPTIRIHRGEVQAVVDRQLARDAEAMDQAVDEQQNAEAVAQAIERAEGSMVNGT